MLASTLGKSLIGTQSPVYTMSVAQAAEAMSVSEDTVRNLILTKALPASRVKKRLVIFHSDIDNYLRRNRV
jgi:excisionase family DNA binding protein